MGLQLLGVVLALAATRQDGGWTVLDMSHLQKEQPDNLVNAQSKVGIEHMKFKQIRTHLRFEPQVGGYVVTLRDHMERAKNAQNLVAMANSDEPSPSSSLHLETFAAIDVAHDKETLSQLQGLPPITPGSKSLLPQERACMHSHIKVIKQIATKNNAAASNKAFLILEDDVQLKPNFQVLLQEYLENSPPSWDILSLFLHHDRHITKVVRTKHQDSSMPSLNHEMATQTDFPFTGMQAYVLTQKSAKRVLNCVKYRFDTIDNMIGCCAGGGGFCKTLMPPKLKHIKKLEAYVMQPSLVRHGLLKTAIHPPGTHGGTPIAKAKIPRSQFNLKPAPVDITLDTLLRPKIRTTKRFSQSQIKTANMANAILSAVNSWANSNDQSTNQASPRDLPTDNPLHGFMVAMPDNSESAHTMVVPGHSPLFTKHESVHQASGSLSSLKAFVDAKDVARVTQPFHTPTKDIHSPATRDRASATGIPGKDVHPPAMAVVKNGDDTPVSVVRQIQLTANAMLHPTEQGDIASASENIVRSFRLRDNVDLRSFSNEM